MGVYKGYQPNIFRAVSGSLFSSPINWSRGYVPAGSDVADIRDNCIIDISRTIGTLVVQSGVTASINSGLTLQINDVINVLGHLSCSGAPTVNVLSYKNTINSLSPGNSTFNFSKVGNQAVPGVTYNNVGIYYQGNKFATGNIIVSGNINYFSADTSNTSSVFELDQYNLSVLGFTSVTNRNHTLSKSKPGRILFTGQLGYGNPSRVLFTGNPTVEFRGGLVGDPDIGGAFLDSGVGTWIFSTNNQSIATFGRPINTDIYISGSITLTVPSGQILGITKILTGTSGSSVLANSGSLYFYTANPVSTFMTTGSANLSSSANTVGFVGNYDLTIPNRFANLWSLLVSGTGTKTLGTSSYFSGSLSLFSNGVLELSSSNLTVIGSTSIQQTSTLQKTSPGGTASFYGGISFPQGAGTLNFTSSNPYVEVRNGIFIGNNTPTFTSGNNKWVFSTNNQTITNNNGPGSGMGITFNCPIIISGPISMSLSALAGSRFYLNLFSPIDGDHLSSSFINTDGILNFFTTSSVNCMATSGTINYSPTGSNNIYNGIGYYMSQDFTIPLNIFNNLYIGSVGTKTLSSNTIVRKGVSLEAPSILDVGNHNLAITGSVLINQGSRLIKSGPGKITISGSLGVYNGYIDFSIGNPDIELKGGWITGNGVNLTGTGSWYFSAPSQSISFFVGNDDFITFRGKGLISSSAQLILTSSYTSVPIFTIIFPSGAYMNGESSTSIFNNRRNIIYQNPDPPMLTGSLWSNAGSFTYNYTGSQTQSIQVPTDPINPSYLNLTLSGSTKVLLGNINVTGTITTGSTIINYNGFTITKI